MKHGIRLRCPKERRTEAVVGDKWVTLVKSASRQPFCLALCDFFFLSMSFRRISSRSSFDCIFDDALIGSLTKEVSYRT
jgi:hypothetical protein